MKLMIDEKRELFLVFVLLFFFLPTALQEVKKRTTSKAFEIVLDQKEAICNPKRIGEMMKKLKIDFRKLMNVDDMMIFLNNELLYFSKYSS